MMNTTSSRSHTVLTLHVKIQQRKKMKRSGALELYERAVCSKLMLVDLAGSERVRRSESQGTRLAEAKSINSSLSALGNVIAALAGQNPEEHPQKQGHTHIPYRDTKLTKLLQDSLGGTASTAIIATVGPAAADYEETLSTLQFASRCMSVRVMTIPHSVSVDFEVLCADLREEVCSLEDALVRQEQVAASQRAVYNITIKQLYAELLESRRLSAVKGSDREKVSSPQPFDFKKLEVFINQLSEAAKSSSTSSSVQWGKEKEKRGTVNPLAPNSIDSSAYKDKMTDHVNIEYESKSPSAQYENGLRFDDIHPAHHSGKDTNVSVSTESFIRVMGDPEVNERVAIRQMEKNGMHLEDPLRKKLIKASSLSVQSNTGMQSGKIQRTQTGSESDTDTESRTQLLVQPEKISDHSGNQKHSWSQPITSGHVLLVDNNSSSSTSYKSHRVPVTSPPTVSPHSTSSSSSKHEGDDSRCGNSDGANSEYPPNRAMEVIREKDRHPWEERADVTTRDARSVVDRIAALSSAQIARMNPAAREQVLAIRRQLLDADRDQRERSAENNYDNQRRGTSTYAANDVHSPTNGSRVQRPPHTQHRYRDCTLDED